MPQTFKALATIAVWVLFLFGLVTLGTAFIRILRAAVGIGDASGVGLMSGYFLSAIASLFLSVVAMKLRKTLE